MEVMYHKDKYKTKSCERWAKPGLQCSWGPRCAYQHGDNDLPNAADRYRQGSDSPPSNIHQSGETEMILTNMSVTNGARGQLQRSSGIAWSLGSNTVTGDKLCPNVNTCAPDVMLLTQKLEATQKQLSQLASGYRSLHKRTECPGCDGSATRDQALACGHFFCRECTNSNLRSEKNNARVSCPVCNVDTPLGKILKLTE
ncbi:hypothetical protein SARC_03413 [Sphaeroforma arctica JP610]|uniref:Uncharacterized protein n=1 Tax=Sphaeroforma arctica JP610 TaxID=667725 RepID=A0A0L0G7Z9_9EUKA|nr:hypothetical protein SARC_03413 [Sphaeroforma arctica JP610]KNC84368.1 hypothetical protein SARC_03413 [Sphaeroforma arctica JP610]|eukprot:XP_014158270.1 hypothetical protein SARC_03413 [Sphaeroforma arctica JP610]